MLVVVVCELLGIVLQEQLDIVCLVVVWASCCPGYSAVGAARYCMFSGGVCEQLLGTVLQERLDIVCLVVVCVSSCWVQYCRSS